MAYKVTLANKVYQPRGNMTQQRGQAPTGILYTSLREMPGPSISNCVPNSVIIHYPTLAVLWLVSAL